MSDDIKIPKSWKELENENAKLRNDADRWKDAAKNITIRARDLSMALDEANKRCKGMARYFRGIEKHFEKSPYSMTSIEYGEIIDRIDAAFRLEAHPEVI